MNMEMGIDIFMLKSEEHSIDVGGIFRAKPRVIGQANRTRHLVLHSFESIGNALTNRAKENKVAIRISPQDEECPTTDIIEAIDDIVVLNCARV